jgi:CheY-like chemotaxis protein
MRQSTSISSSRRWRWPTSLILVVDDNRDAADVLALLLRRWGYRVLIAYNGAAALGLVEAEWPTLAIIDVNMPVMSGIELARRLRQRFHGRPLPLYALTAVDFTTSEVPAREFDAYFLKPADQDDLREHLERDCSKVAEWSALN